MEGFLWLIVFAAIYLFPTLIAWRRRHASVMAIALVNILLGWSLIGWLWALIWSLTGNTRAIAR